MGLEIGLEIYYTIGKGGVNCTLSINSSIFEQLKNIFEILQDWRKEQTRHL